MDSKPTGRSFVLWGTILVLIAMLTGLVSGSLANPRMGLSSHLAALGGGTLLIALGSGWGHVRLSASAERWALGLLVGGNYANWLVTLLAAIWGAGRAMMPIAGGSHQGNAWQEMVIGGMLVALSLAVIAGLAVVIRGIVAGRD